MNQAALPLPGMADAAMERAANLSACGTYRWTLSRRWASGGSSVCWIMLNPSTADAEVDDPTIREVIRFSRLWGYQAATVVNLYPFRSSSPAKCRRWADWEAHGPDWAVRDLIQENAEVVAREARGAELVIAAWGAAPWASDWAQHVAEEYVLGSSRPWDLYCLGTNSDGSPRHPLARGRHRVPREQHPVIYL